MLATGTPTDRLRTPSRWFLALALATGAAMGHAAAQVATVLGEGALKNNTPLPTNEAAETALARGDAAWSDRIAAAAGDRPGLRTRAFDAWREAIDVTAPGDAVRLVPASAEPDRILLFPDPDGTHARRSEDVAVAVLRRLATLSTDDRTAWTARFEGGAGALLTREFRRSTPSLAGLGEVERTFPATRAAARAALALADLELESARPSAAMVWLHRGRTHVQLGASSWSPSTRAAFEHALGLRESSAAESIARRFIGDHTAPQRRPPSTRSHTAHSGPSPELQRISGPTRISRIGRTHEEPYGLGLGSGIAFFTDGAALVQGSYGVVLLGNPRSKGAPGVHQVNFPTLLGVRRPHVVAAASAGGWSAFPASDGKRIALVVGRGERPRPFLKIELPPNGNVLCLVEHGAKDRPIEPLWVLRDGFRIDRPAPGRPSSGGLNLPSRGGPSAFAGQLTEGWTIGRGWEFQPGPVLLDDTLFVLARGLGDPTSDEGDNSDEVLLIALDTTSCRVLWTREVTGERGLTDPTARGRAGYFATTTMPLTVERSTGQVLVGTNVGLLCAYDVADGRLTWAVRNQRRGAHQAGWSGSRAPILTGRSPGAAAPTAWFTPFDSGHAYALPAGPAPLDGSLFMEPPRARRGALDLAAVLLPERAHGASSLILLGRDGRHAAVLLEGPDGGRRVATYLAPDERFGGRPALGAGGLLVAGTHELGILSLADDLRLVSAAPMYSSGAGRGGDVVLFRGHVYVVGRDTVWVWRLP